VQYIVTVVTETVAPTNVVEITLDAALDDVATVTGVYLSVDKMLEEYHRAGETYPPADVSRQLRRTEHQLKQLGVENPKLQATQIVLELLTAFRPDLYTTAMHTAKVVAK
jgi:hypothetical protein